MEKDSAIQCENKKFKKGEEKSTFEIVGGGKKSTSWYYINPDRRTSQRTQSVAVFNVLRTELIYTHESLFYSHSIVKSLSFSHCSIVCLCLMIFFSWITVQGIYTLTSLNLTSIKKLKNLFDQNIKTELIKKK